MSDHIVQGFEDQMVYPTDKLRHLQSTQRLLESQPTAVEVRRSENAIPQKLDVSPTSSTERLETISGLEGKIFTRLAKRFRKAKDQNLSDDEKGVLMKMGILQSIEDELSDKQREGIIQIGTEMLASQRRKQSHLNYQIPYELLFKTREPNSPPKTIPESVHSLEGYSSILTPLTPPSSPPSTPHLPSLPSPPPSPQYSPLGKSTNEEIRKRSSKPPLAPCPCPQSTPLYCCGLPPRQDLSESNSTSSYRSRSSYRSPWNDPCCSYYERGRSFHRLPERCCLVDQCCNKASPCFQRHFGHHQFRNQNPKYNNAVGFQRGTVVYAPSEVSYFMCSKSHSASFSQPQRHCALGTNPKPTYFDKNRGPLENFKPTDLPCNNPHPFVNGNDVCRIPEPAQNTSLSEILWGKSPPRSRSAVTCRRIRKEFLSRNCAELVGPNGGSIPLDPFFGDTARRCP